MLDVSKKIEGIMQSRTLDDLSIKYLPPVSDSPDNYYFISYSHKDYKQVYADIYSLQGEGVNVWYDRAMEAGVSWKETAEKYIRPSRCAGVVFYVSENSLLSPAIHEEIAFAKQCGKSCLTVNLPMQGNKALSAKEMLDALAASGIDISKEKYDFISQSFNEDVLYLPYSASAEQKADKILRLKKPDSFEFKVVSDRVILTAVKDIEIRKITADQLIYIDKNTKRPREVNEIGKCAFANCTALESIELPASVSKIDENAFYGCRLLKHIDLRYIHEVGKYAFSECVSLKSIVMPSKEAVGDNYWWRISYFFPIKIYEGAFFGCRSLEEVILTSHTKLVDKFAFANCGCKKLYIEKDAAKIDEEAFVYCRNLQEIYVDSENKEYVCIDNCLIDRSDNRIVLGCASSKIPDNGQAVTIGAHSFEGSGISSLIIPNGIEVIEEEAFCSCEDLMDVYIGKDLKRIQAGAFWQCGRLRSVHISDLTKWCEIDFELQPFDDDYSDGSNGFYSSNPLMYAHNLYLNGSLAVSLVIPDGVEKIKNGTFQNCLSVNAVALPPSVTDVEDNAFDGCDRLAEIINESNCILPDTLGDVWSVHSLAERKFGVTQVDGMVFYIDDERSCLVGFTELVENVVLPEYPNGRRYTLHDMLFSHNTVVKSIALPNDVSVKDVSLVWCDNLKEITVKPSNKRYISFNGVLYSKLGDHVIFVPPDTDDHLEIRRSVTTLDLDVLFNCKKIKTLIVPIGVKLLKGSCVSLRMIKYRGTVRQWQSIAYKGDFWDEFRNITVVCSDGEAPFIDK